MFYFYFLHFNSNYISFLMCLETQINKILKLIMIKLLTLLIKKMFFILNFGCFLFVVSELNFDQY